MNIKKLHKILGIIMLVPLILWSVTGVIFLFKPGYEGAYERLYPKLYPINKVLSFEARHWTETKTYRTILGEHLLVKQQGTWQHLNLADMHVWPIPSEQAIFTLIDDAISQNKQRYGEILRIDGQTIYTDTGITITLDWQTLSLRQKGPDTNLIDMLYKIHYLQWLNSENLNKALGLTGLALLVLMSVIGFALVIRSSKQRNKAE